MATQLAEDFPNVENFEFGLGLDEARKYLKQVEPSN